MENVKAEATQEQQLQQRRLDAALATIEILRSKLAAKDAEVVRATNKADELHGHALAVRGENAEVSDHQHQLPNKQWRSSSDLPPRSPLFLHLTTPQHTTPHHTVPHHTCNAWAIRLCGCSDNVPLPSGQHLLACNGASASRKQDCKERLSRFVSDLENPCSSAVLLLGGAWWCKVWCCHLACLM